MLDTLPGTNIKIPKEYKVEFIHELGGNIAIMLPDFRPNPRHLGFITKIGENWHVNAPTVVLHEVSFNSCEDAKRAVQESLVKNGIREYNPNITPVPTGDEKKKIPWILVAKRLTIASIVIYLFGSVIDRSLDGPTASGIFAFTVQELFSGLALTALISAGLVFAKAKFDLKQADQDTKKETQ